jgi:micrococcal nuclease
MNNVVKFKPSRRSMPFPVVVAAVIAVGMGGGMAAHYVSQSDTAVSMIDRMETAAAEAAPVKLTETPLAARKTSKRFSLCSGPVRVTCVVDGDTLWLDGTKIRIADIDTPEVSNPKCKSEKALGDRATRRLLQLVNQGPFEVQAWPDRDEDKHGRKLRVLVRGGRSLGDILVREGLARTWTGRRQPWC